MWEWNVKKVHKLEKALRDFVNSVVECYFLEVRSAYQRTVSFKIATLACTLVVFKIMSLV